MLCNCFFILCMRQEPRSSSMCIGHGLLGREGFGGNKEKCGFWINSFQRLSNMGTIYIGHKKHLQIRVLVSLQGFCHHHWSKIRTTNANIYECRDWLSRVSQPASLMDLGGKGLHLSQYCIYFRHDIFAIHQNWSIGTVAEGCMKHGTVLRLVDRLAFKHALDTLC